MSGPTIQNGYLVLADLSGFTPFMASTELDHAQGILVNLLGVLRNRLTPTLQLAEIEGDALFLYAPGHRLKRGETLLELIESTYVAFRDKLRTMQHNATCACAACRAIPTLDLKFITHCGEFVLQDLTGAPKPFGNAVNLAHRLLKNRVTESTGWNAYALFTESALARMAISPDGIHDDTLSYEHLGEVAVGAIDLHARYRELTAERFAFLTEGDAHFTMHRRFPASSPRLWEYLSDPDRRGQWELGSDWHARQRPGGRAGRGAQNHCANSGFIEEVLDWRPFEYFTVRMTWGFLRMVVTSELRPADDATDLRWSMCFEGAAPRLLRASACRVFARHFVRTQARFERLDRLLHETDDWRGEGTGEVRDNGRR